jgi:hypothetical protein
MYMTDKNLKITGFAVCAMGHFRGHDADERRANKLSNGRVACITCGGYSTDIDHATIRKIDAQPKLIKDVIVALIEGHTPEAPASGISFTEGTGFGAVAQGFGPDDVPTGITIALGNDVKVSILFTNNDVQCADKSVALTGSTSREQITGEVPSEADEALKKLTALGFSFLHANVGNAMRNFTLVKGYRIPGKTTVLGVRADISWIVV